MKKYFTTIYGIGICSLILFFNEVTFSQVWIIVNTHNFNNNFSGGKIIINGDIVDAPAMVQLYPDDNTQYPLSAIDNQYGDSYYRIFSNWNLNGSYRTSNITTWFKYGTGSEGGNYNIYHDAIFKKICNITFSGNSSVYVNGTLYSSPKTTQVIELNPVTASAQSYSSNNVNFTFENWKKDGLTYPATFTPTDHGSYNAVYRAKPSNSGEYVSFGNNYNQPIVIYWNDCPNTNVTQYQIWRRVKHNGVTGPETLIATVGRGVQTYTDYDYALTSTYTDDLLWYDVRAYYNSTDSYIIGDYSDALYSAVYGRVAAKINENALAQETVSEIPTEYYVGNFPNPFNPTTTIKYQLPEAGMVTLKVYDILGREVAELVNENKSAGYFEVNFDASRLTSGVYIYTIQAGKYTESKKMILAK